MAAEIRSEPLVHRIVHTVSMTFAVVAAVLISIIMVSTVADVIERQRTGASIPGVVEYSEVFMVALIYLGLAYAQRVGAHIGVDILVTRLPARAAHVVQSVGLCVVIVVLAWMTYETAQVALASFGNREYRFGIVQVPIWPARALIPVGLAALVLALFLEFYDHVTGLRRLPAGTPSSDVRESL